MKKKINNISAAVFGAHNKENFTKMTLKDINEYLKLNNEDRMRIGNLEFKKISSRKGKISAEPIIISLNDLKGVTHRDLSYNCENWNELLANIKFKNFSKNSNSFEEMYEYLSDKSKLDTMDLPIVIKYNNEYYIEEGMHRLTIAKCIGVKDFQVIIEDCD